MEERKRKLEKNNGNADRIEDIPKIPKSTPVEAEDFAFNEKRWLIAERINHINQLPLEILDMIFRKYLTSRDRKNVRLVCQSWYIRGQPYGEKLIFCPKSRRRDDVVLSVDPFSDDIELQHFKNCGFKNLNLLFSGTNVSLIPRAVWQTVGARIYSLNLSYCRLGDSAMEFIVLYCENLRILRLMIEDVEDLFYSVKKLEKLNVTRRTLDTLQIHLSSLYFWEDNRKQFDFEEWRQMYCTIHRIFPNVTHYNCGSDADSLMLKNEVRFRVEISVDEFSRKSDTSKSGLNVALAYAMSANNNNALSEDGRRALQALSTVRLTCVSLFWAKPTFESEDKDVILDFFASQKKLESIDCELKEDYRHLKPYNLRRFTETLTSIALHILSTCFQLRKLYYCNSLNWLPSENKTIYTQIFTKTCKLEKFAIGKLLVEGSTMRSWRPSWFGHTYQRTIRVLPPYYPHLVHLILREKIGYDVLERVFKYMINLKSLEVDLHYSCRTMSKIRENNGNGISMKQLQNLERLKVHLSIKKENGVIVDDDLFDGFEFPKLCYLYCPLPKETSVLNHIGVQMPSLREVDFSQTAPDSENLESPAVDIFQTIDTTKIFARCSPLRSLRYWRGTYFHEIFTQKVIFAEN